MKLPSLFRSPRYKRFDYQPRYYDEVREDIQKRTERIQQELGKDIPKNEKRISQIQGSFHNLPIKTKKKGIPFTFVLIILLSCGTFGYLYYGKEMLYLSVGLTILLSIFKQRLKIFN